MTTSDLISEIINKADDLSAIDLLTEATSNAEINRLARKAEHLAQLLDRLADENRRTGTQLALPLREPVTGPTGP